MSDTIDLLEAIGRDASLRYAPADVLSDLLDQAQASPTLMAAAASGDSSVLSRDLGQGPNQAPQVVQTPGFEEEEAEEDGEPAPLIPSVPDQSKPHHQG